MKLSLFLALAAIADLTIQSEAKKERDGHAEAVYTKGDKEPTHDTKAEKEAAMSHGVFSKASKPAKSSKSSKGAKSAKTGKAAKVYNGGAGSDEHYEGDGHGHEGEEEHHEEDGHGHEEEDEHEEHYEGDEHGHEEEHYEGDGHGHGSGPDYFRYPPHLNLGDNPCIDSSDGPLEYFFGEGASPATTVPCDETGEQTGTDISVGYTGEYDEPHFAPFAEPLHTAGMCAANAHFHLGSEHRSEGQFEKLSDSFDAKGPSPLCSESDDKLCFPDGVTRCNLYDESDPRFTTEYKFEHCLGVKVGETYEVHWPSSVFASCGTVWQYQNPFWDGLTCGFPQGAALAATFVEGTFPPVFAATEEMAPVPNLMGVQGQVFTIINDEDYYYPDMFRGIVTDPSRNMGIEVTKFTGSRTGSGFDNVEKCDPLYGVTWQVDRNCHLISASSFDKMCADMKAQAGMYRCGESECGKIPKEYRVMIDGEECCVPSLYPSGAREVVPDEQAANNHVWDRHYRNLHFAY